MAKTPYTQFDIGGCGCACDVTICVYDNIGGAPISGASVGVKSGATLIASGTTGGSGCVVLNILAAGTYNILVTASGYNGATYSGVALTCGETFNSYITPNGYACCGIYPEDCCLPQSDLTLNGDITLVYSPLLDAPFRWLDSSESYFLFCGDGEPEMAIPGGEALIQVGSTCSPVDLVFKDEHGTIYTVTS
jgi:Carboxypeptidase regulatory-like domain